jgi:hypothetical protein
VIAVAGQGLLEILGAREPTARVGLAELAAVAVGRRHVGVARVALAQDVVGVDARCTSGAAGGAVVAPAPRQDARLSRLAAHGVVEACEAKVGLVGFAAAVVEEHVAQAPVGRQQAYHLFRQASGRLVAEVPEGGVVGDLAHLGGDGVGDLAATVAHVDVEQPREAVDHAAAVGQLQLDAVTAHEYLGSAILVLAELTDGMDHVCTIECLDFLEIRDGVGHDSLRGGRWFGDPKPSI